MALVIDRFSLSRTA